MKFGALKGHTCIGGSVSDLSGDVGTSWGIMRELPILFSTPMVQAIQDLRKSMTRRLNNLEEINQEPDKWKFKGIYIDPKGTLFAEFYSHPGRAKAIKCPWRPGDHLWVRETWQAFYAGNS